jgi:hypothetical protein
MTPQLEQTLMAEEETTSGEAKFSVTPLARAFLVSIAGFKPTAFQAVSFEQPVPRPRQ